jgi:hypothetical protein
MTPPSMESIFLILSGVILVAGVLYWLWSHIQLTQKKVQLLENAVFELRGMLANSGGGAPAPMPLPPSSPTRQVQVTTSSATVAAALEQHTDEDDNGWGAEDHKSTPLEDLVDTPVLEVEDALQPGGRAMAVMEIDLDAPAPASAPVSPAPAPVSPADQRAEQFRNLFAVQQEKVVTMDAEHPADAPAISKTPESLESMPLKELRRLAEQRGIAGAGDMRKKEILSALRQQVTVSMTLPDSGINNSDDVKEIAINAIESTAEILE